MYKNYLLAILSGLLLAFSWPTYGFSLLIFIAFVPLLLAEKSIRNSSKRNNIHSFFTAYLAFFIWNAITTWWIWNSTHVGAIFALVVNSLLMTLVFHIYHLVAKRKTARFSLIFLITFWIAFEKFHQNWDFSWPWLNLGNVFSNQASWIQWYEYTGIFGGSLWIWLVNALLFASIASFQKTSDLRKLLKRGILSTSIVIIGIFVSLYLYHTYKEKGTVFTAIVLQPNTDPYTEKYHQSHDKIASDLLKLTQTQMDASVSLVLAPETVFSTNMTLPSFQKSPAYRSVQNYLTKHSNTGFLTGIDLYKAYPSTQKRSLTANSFSNSDSWYESFNAAILIVGRKNKSTPILSKDIPPQVYHKSKLVVGVEHFPFRSVLQPLLGDVMINLGGGISTLTPQAEAEAFSLPNKALKAAPIICYESIYGEYVGKYAQKGSNFLAIITNDSWWGRTQGHKQLLSYARLRAVEQRRAIARSANSGISAFINQKGDIVSSLTYETQGALKGSLLANDEITFYGKHGDYIARITSFVAILFLLIGLFVRKKV